MNEKCKYCKHLNKCFDKVEYNSFYCLAHRVFPKIVEKSYDEIVKENQKLKQQLEQRDNIINKAREFAKGHIFQFDGDKDFEALLEILDNKGDEK